jgi:NAD(P)-dependent dehydrogenase (short-subunit alcohol dehydrogenase family)
MDLNLNGKTALVTGASKGIGLAVAKALAAEGCNLHLAARGKEALEAAREAVRKRHQIAVALHPLDLSRSESVGQLAESCRDIDILINNAGAIPGGGIFQVDDASWRAGWELKVFGYINMTRAYFARMSERKRGVIINICGLGGERLDAGYIAGAAGNASLMAFSRALGGASIHSGVRVLAVNPGPVETDRVVYLGKERAKRELGDENRWREAFAKMPYGRPATVDEVAPMVVFLASERSHYISGTVVTVDGGMANRGAN